MAYDHDASHPTGILDNSPKGTGAAVKARERKAMAALELRKRNVPWGEIAEALGFPSAKHAHTAVERTLADCFDEESQDLLRRMAAAHLEDMLYALRGKAMDPDNAEQVSAVNQRRQLIETHMKLLGYARPTEVAIYNPLDSEVSEFVAATIRKDSAGKQLEESDIFEMTEGEDGVYTLPPTQPPSEKEVEDFIDRAEEDDYDFDEDSEVAKRVASTLALAKEEQRTLQEQLADF